MLPMRKYHNLTRYLILFTLEIMLSEALSFLQAVASVAFPVAIHLKCVISENFVLKMGKSKMFSICQNLIL